MANPADITTRLIALRSDMTGITAADDELPDSLTDALLPFLLVMTAGASYTVDNSNTLEIARTWTLLLWVKAFEQGSKTSEKTARDACDTFFASVPKFYAQRRRLQSAGNSGLAYVTSAVITADDGPQMVSHGERRFYGVPFRLTVTYADDLTPV
jgi:hypothetical protein